MVLREDVRNSAAMARILRGELLMRNRREPWPPRVEHELLLWIYGLLMVYFCKTVMLQDNGLKEQ